MCLKFKRQKPVGPYIADFICNEYKLVIECDGSQHGDSHDTVRDAWLNTNGYTVLRFWNIRCYNKPSRCWNRYD
ncbi:MAG: endonuclease domain-containing protein [Steroidobacteraceae bacterium]